MSFMKDFDHLKIQLEDVLLATENFGRDRQIGCGGFGQVYKGKLTLSNRRRAVVAFKRLDRKFGQGNIEFWKEIMMLSNCTHENLVSLLHFCIDGDERILVYEYASRGSLDRYLSDTGLTWMQRLKICVGVARGLNYLHDPMKTQQRVLHRDIKSANILLDERWTPKVSDFGLSKVAPANQMRTYLVSNAVGTPGYCDPVYVETGFLTKESDVYSLGVVLFEVMCGRPCCEFRNSELVNILVPTWKRSYEEKRLDNIICRGLKEQMKSDSLETFSTIANRCLNRDPKGRPSMAEIVKTLELALGQQNFDPENDVLVNIAKRAVHPLSYTTHHELHSLLSQGILVAGRETWLSVNKSEGIREMISAIKCVSGGWLVHETVENSRFPNVLGGLMYSGFKVKGRTQFLSPYITYVVNLVFKHNNIDHETHVPFKYKLDNETHYSNSSITIDRGDGWLMTQLYRFMSYYKEHDFGIEFVLPVKSSPVMYYFEGVEFKPMENNVS